ncbi:serine hydrolase [Pseudorhodoferax sp. Leaf265]|uniref:serine hydrolase domain-containing protein n=1 Tax=Pseudorhodoferax sp. Leaf265 TaxID=1736315 RepID=UPI0006FDEEB6|nr:serine hydrolase domain-containing protein [Pseudorhodoferax sp. Leaf265]KQP02210.1 serine hydrolase [Pseudorhodoferax sp. Leaf265]PZP99906.1 MAG: serine hydrolase [Variovorax paradoxus]PZQ12111.1 MAG: serine hydrolase [Variovorax paradoxus]
MTITRRQLAFSALGSTFLAGCASPPAVPRTIVSTDRLGRIAPALDAQVRIGTFAGAVSLVAQDGKIVQHEAVGFLDAAKTRPMPRDAIFRLASMTKPITSVATMMLAEQGQLKINDPVTNWLPELKNLKVETPQGDVALARPITVQDLLMHTAGLVYGPASPSPRIGKMYADLNIESLETDITGDEMLKRLGTIPLLYQPGTTWFYSIATDVLGLLLERVSGKRLDALTQELLLGPLGMTDTAWWVPPAKRARLAETLDSDPLKAAMTRAYRQDSDPAPRQYLKGGAGLTGTGADYLKFAQMVLNGGTDGRTRYLSRKTTEFMLSDHLVGKAGVPNATTGPGYGFGLGWGVRLYDGVGWTPGSVGDAMWAGAWGTSFWIDPRERLAGVLMAQCPSNRIHTRMLYKNLVYGAVS